MVFSAGFDSAGYRQQMTIRGKPHLTLGLVGVGIRTEDTAAFTKAYKQALTAVFKKFGIKQGRPAYCAAELSAILGAQAIDKEREALDLFLKDLLPAVDQVHLFYTFLFNFETVTIFGDDPDGYERIPVVSRESKVTDFYDLISPSYTMLCAWNYASDRHKDILLLDHFQGKISPAWNEFSQTTNARIYFNGDRCNALVSAADLVTRLVKLRMLENRARFLEREMDALLPECGKKFIKHFLGSCYLKKMVPHKRTRINCNSFVKHPCWFVVLENPEDAGERAMVEATPAFNSVLEKAFEKDGCVKFFHKDADTRIICGQDVLVSYGERGEKIAKSLKKLGKEFEHEAK
ncbi:MAG: hypothetical protein V1811_00915 [Candidatus Micrarchaeota archaeon]